MCFFVGFKMKELITFEFVLNTLITISLLIAAFVFGVEIKIISIVCASFYGMIYLLLGIPHLINFIKSNNHKFEEITSDLQQNKTIF